MSRNPTFGLVAYSDSDTESDSSSSEYETSSSEEECEKMEISPCFSQTPEDLVWSILLDLVQNVVVSSTDRKIGASGKIQSNLRRNPKEMFQESDSDSSSSSSSSSYSSSSSSSESEDEVIPSKDYLMKQVPKVKGELTSADLPPIEDLHISVPEVECVLIGNISSIVDDMVVVKALPSTPACNIDSVFFLEVGKRPLGHVFDVFGPVIQPFYSVRFNSNADIKAKDISIGMSVYFAPRTKHTLFVFLAQLREMKGSDASWRHDKEVRKKHQDFSDDEEERTMTRKLQGNVGFNSRGNNPFYRRAKRRSPGGPGQIRWNSNHAMQYPNFYSPPPGFIPNRYVRPSSLMPFQYGAPQPHPSTSFHPPRPSLFQNYAFRHQPPPPPPPPGQ